MSDPSKFINTYIDTTIATLHEYVGSSLQLKTQLRIANDLASEKDGIIVQKDATIENLMIEIENLKNDQSKEQGNAENLKSDLFVCEDKLRIAEESHAALKVKLTHMDSLMSQVSDMKREIISRDLTISNNNGSISSLEERIRNLETEKSSSEARTKNLEIDKNSLEERIRNLETEKFSMNEKIRNLEEIKVFLETKIIELQTPEETKISVKTENQSSSNAVVSPIAKLNTKVRTTKTKEPDDDF